MWKFKRALAVVTFGSLCMSLMACSELSGGNSSDGATQKVAAAAADVVVPDLTFIDDSFERNDIATDGTNEFGWRGFVLDGANPVLAFQSNGAGATIPPAGALGPAFDGDRFLLMTGRTNDAPVEQVHVISQSYDLSQFKSVILSFRYLTFALNDAGDAAEDLKVQVCRGTLNDCGANDDVLNAGGLLTNNWVTVFTSSTDGVNDDNLNGKNHQLSDWRTGLAVIDLTNPEFVSQSSTFVFRFVATMKDGYKLATTTGGNSGNECKDKKEKSDRKISSITVQKNDHRDHHDCDHKHGHCKYKDHDHHQGDDCKHKHDDCDHTGGGTTVPADGTLLDGAAVDKVSAIATQRAIDEIF